MAMISYAESLKEKAMGVGSILCMGIDPILEDIPIKADAEHSITQFYFDILDAAQEQIPSVKPNIAFFEQYGFEGLRALKKIIEKAKNTGFDVILDAKRADIGKTSAAYARSVFHFWNADAVTVNPYMGSDSMMPFIEHCSVQETCRILKLGRCHFI
jgi:orotidine 5'-phosphate decarboxylase subfamily 2